MILLQARDKSKNGNSLLLILPDIFGISFIKGVYHLYSTNKNIHDDL